MRKFVPASSLIILCIASMVVPLAAVASDTLGWGGAHGGHHGPDGGGWGHAGGWHRGGAGGVVIGSPFPGGPFPTPYPVPDPAPYPAPRPYPTSGAVAPGEHGPLPPAWFYCDGPEGFYPYVKNCPRDWQAVPIPPPPPGSGAPPLLQGWAYCYERRGYYPYVEACSEPWELVEAGTPRDIELPETPIWYFCGSTKSYFPYTANCTQQWEKVPAMPPPNAVPSEKQRQIGPTHAAYATP